LPLHAAATAAVASASVAITAASAAIIAAAAAAAEAAARENIVATVPAAPSAITNGFSKTLAVGRLGTGGPGGVKGATSAKALVVDGALPAADKAQALSFGLIVARSPPGAAARPLDLHGALAAPAQDAAF